MDINNILLLASLTPLAVFVMGFLSYAYCLEKKCLEKQNAGQQLASVTINEKQNFQSLSHA